MISIWLVSRLTPFEWYLKKKYNISKRWYFTRKFFFFISNYFFSFQVTSQWAKCCFFHSNFYIISWEQWINMVLNELVFLIQCYDVINQKKISNKIVCFFVWCHRELSFRTKISPHQIIIFGFPIKKNICSYIFGY